MQVLHNNICLVKAKDYLSKGYDSLVAKYQYVFAENDEGEIYPVASRYEKRPIAQLFSNGFFGANVNVNSGLKALEVPRLDRATEVLPQAVEDSKGSSPSSNPIQSILDQYSKAGENAQKNPTSQVHKHSDSELVLIGMGVVVQAENMVRAKQNLEELQNLRREEMKRTKTEGKTISNKDNRVGLRGLPCRLRYSWNFFRSSFKSFDQEKLNWYLSRKS
jgi:hypothetical protein